MDLTKVLEQLRAELENLDAAIASLERIQQGSRRRGRPPVWLNKARPKSRNGSREPDNSDGDEH
jgi:hypothetical protein